MINLTGDVVFLKQGKDLDKELKKALNKIYKCERDYCKQFKGLDSKRSYQERQYTERCNPKDIKDTVNSELVINTAMNAVQSDSLLGFKTTAARVNKFLALFDNEGVKVNYLPSIRRPVARLLIELRSKKCIALPLYFPALNYIPYFEGRYPSLDGMNVYKHFIKHYYDTKESGKSASQVSGMISIVLATDWNDAKDISLNDVSYYHRVWSGYIEVKNAVVPKTKVSKLSFAKQLNKVHGELSFSKDDMDMFVYWVSSFIWVKEYSFSDYVENRDELHAEQTKVHNVKRVESSRKYRVKKVIDTIMKCDEGDITTKEALTTIFNGSALSSTDEAKKFLQRKECVEVISNDENMADTSRSAGRVFLAELAGKGEIENYYINVTRIQRKDNWFDIAYPGFENVDLKSMSKHWHKLYDLWIDDRIKDGKESIKLPQRGFVAVFDYIFLYLPLWIDANPDTNIEIPIYPKEFDRFTFVHRDYFDDDSELLPLTLYEMFELRYGKGSSTFSQIFLVVKQFFLFLQKKRKKLVKYLGNEWQNPIEQTDKFSSGSRNKTPKVAFEEEASPWILRYFYALNEYGVYLQNLALESDYFSTLNVGATHLSKYRMINTAKEFGGYVPVISGRDINGKERSVSLNELPNVFAFNTRVVKQKDGTEKNIILPDLTACRVNIAMYETGRRNSNARHLCRDTWDELNSSSDDGDLYFELNVNTDKTQDSNNIMPAPMLKRLRNILKQEEVHQRQLSLTEEHKEVKYLDREHTRFDPFVPLFRSANNDKPIGDSVVRKCFGWMIWGVQETLNEYSISEFNYKWVTYNENDNKVILPKETNTHTFRANFISDRFPFFPDDINILTSQKNLKVSGHYYSPSRRDIKNRFLAADNKIHGLSNVNDLKETSATESFDGSVHLHPSNPNSALRKSWESNREETIDRFHFVMVNTLPVKLDKESERGMEILKVSKSSQIKWFDTHACPVNMQCPDNIILITGASHRCGICPIAAKCIDHIPAIRAERRAIGARIIQANALIKKLREEGVSTETIRKVQKDKQLDTIEFSGWQAAEKYLINALNNSEDDSDAWHVQMPEMVKLHLDMVVPPSSGQSYLLERVAAVQAYPALSVKDPTLEAKTKMLALKIANDQGLLNEAIEELNNDLVDPINLLTNSMSVMMKANGIKPEELYKKIKRDEDTLLEKNAIDYQDDSLVLQEDK